MLDLSPKQKRTLKESNARMNFWVGAVRSGKSFVSIMRWLEYIQKSPPGNLVMIGKTASTIKHNLVDEICNLIGADAKYYVGKNELWLWGRRIYLIAAVDERSEQRIRGSSFAGAYVDEATLIPESFWVMLLSRISVPNAKLFATTNPDSPYHYIKKNYLDRAQELDIKIFNFYLEDNPSLTEEFKKNLQVEYQGLWYKRYIEGEWCLAEGTIYDFFDESIHCIDYVQHAAKTYIVGVDYGTTNPTAFVLIGHNPNVFPNMWVEKEYYYDSHRHNRQKTDTEYAEDLRRFIQDYPIYAIYVDPSAESFKTEMRRQGIRNVMDAENDVVDGIRFVSSLLNNGTLKVLKTCGNLIKEFQSYVWDPKSRDHGVDKPLKANDHCFAAGTLITTSKGQIPIENLKVKDQVLTPIGYKSVLKAFVHEEEVYEYSILGQKIQCTKDHKFFISNGWKKSSDLLQSDMFLININECECPLKQSYFKESNIEGIYPPRISLIEDISERINQIVLKDTDIFIETFGNSTMEKYPKECTFITMTEIPLTMTLAISDFYQFVSIYPNMLQILLKNKKKIEEKIWKELDLLQKNGIDLKKEENGIESMPKTALPKENIENFSVINARINLLQKNYQTQNFVQIIVNQDGEEVISLMMNLEYANSVIKNLEQINIQKLKHVQSHVDSNYVGKRKVYNLMIENFHAYYAHNILTLNCCDALRYSLFTHFGQSLGEKDRMKPEDIAKLRREAEFN